MNWCGLFWGWMCKIYPLSYYALTDMSVLKTYLDQFLCRVTFYSFIYSLTQVRVDCPASLYQVVVFILNNVSFFVKLPPPPLKKGQMCLQIVSLLFHSTSFFPCIESKRKLDTILFLVQSKCCALLCVFDHCILRDWCLRVSQHHQIKIMGQNLSKEYSVKHKPWSNLHFAFIWSVNIFNCS